MTLTVTSPAFESGQPIPRKHAHEQEGDNVSPPLRWSGAPPETKSFAIIADDPDAPSPSNPRPDPWVHWVLWNVPGDCTELREGNSGGGQSGTNDFNKTGYGGPLPPPTSGKHRYFFKVYALDTTLDLSQSATKANLLDAMEGHILAQGETHGIYERR
jgi:hypothetical protein